jgi:hypothetical protein
VIAVEDDEALIAARARAEIASSAIADAFEASGEQHEGLLGAVALALELQTWRTLVGQQGLEDDRAVELMVGMVRCLMRS